MTCQPLWAAANKIRDLQDKRSHLCPTGNNRVFLCVTVSWCDIESRFGYAVQDDIGNDFNQQEQSDGDTITGQYSVLLPDGRIQTVTYSVRPETGFVVSWGRVCCIEIITPLPPVSLQYHCFKAGLETFTLTWKVKTFFNS